MLGSLVRTTNASGAVIDSLDYKAFGLRVSYTNPQTITYAGSSLSIRGFTGHEQSDVVDMDVIHMNGRIYDPELGRFLQPDPMIQAPGNLQSWNAYTYVFNNPLTLVDPTGMFSLKRALRIVVAAVVSYFTYGAASGWAAGWLAANTAISAANIAIVAGMAGGAAAGFMGGGIATGTLKGAVQGAFTGLVFGGIAGGFGSDFSWGKVGTSGMAGGILTELQGGNFGHGFLSAGLSAATGSFIQGMENDFTRVGLQALVGGTVSELTGGKFANGAATSALQAAVSAMASRIAKDPGRPLTENEIAAAREAYGDDIKDYDRVRVYSRKWMPFQGRDVAMAVMTQ